MSPSEFDVLKTICKNIEKRLEEVIEGQRRMEARQGKHETRITVLETYQIQSKSAWKKYEGFVVAIIQAIAIVFVLILLQKVGLQIP